MSDDKSTWWTAGDLREELERARNTDVKVEIRGILVPISGFYYNSAADSYVVELADGEDLKIALAPDVEG